MPESKDKSMEQETSDSRVYELGYLFVPTLGDEKVPESYGNLKATLVEKFQAEVISDEMPKMIQLAYPMHKVIANVRHKFETGYFGWIKFAAGADQVLELKKQLGFDPDIIRFLILKTVRENTLATKKFVRRDVGVRRPFTVNKSEEAVPIDKEKIDQEIDALVASQ